MKLLLTLFIVFTSMLTFAKSEKKMHSLMHSYLHSIKTADKVKLKEILSEKYFNLLNKDKQLDQLFKQQTNDNKKITFDLKFQKYHNKKDHFLVNIKDKSQKEYDHHWYVVILKDGKYKILKEEYLD